MCGGEGNKNAANAAGIAVWRRNVRSLGQHGDMTDNPVPAIEKIINDVHAMLRRRLRKAGLGEIAHVLMTVTPAGTGIIRSNCDPEGLREMAAMLVEIADQVQAPVEGKPH
jgi:hypothetical protein